VKVSIAAQPAEPRRTQNGLFQPSAPEAERLEVTLARIQSMVDGRWSMDEEPRVGSAEMLDTHRPDAFCIKKFAAPSTIDHRPSTATTVIALRLFRPPIAAQIVLRAGKPVRIECEPVQGEIAWAAGPWKASGEWWSEKPWAREEWDACVGAACYRIYRNAKGWFVEGTYD
jgi:protein ImuB